MMFYVKERISRSLCWSQCKIDSMNTSHSNILIVFGGESSEHDVSLRSAQTVADALASTSHQLSFCYIDTDGRWWLADAAMIPDEHHELVPLLGQGAFLVKNTAEIIRPTVVFPVLHGKHGEDGTVQGLLELLHLPYVGPRVESAAVTMDKDLTKRLLVAAHIPVVPWVAVRRDDTPRFEELVAQLGPTLFVKPSRAGSSVGVSKVRTKTQLQQALQIAFQHDDVVLVEAAVDARELEIAVLGDHDARVSGVGEILPGEEFYSYDDKYANDSASAVAIPAQISPETRHQLQAYALKVHRLVGGTGMNRVDFFLDRNSGRTYLNEINSIPGFTSISMYPQLWRAAGVDTTELVEQLIQLALSA